MELFDYALIVVCAVIRSNMVFNLTTHLSTTMFYKLEEICINVNVVRLNI